MRIWGLRCPQDGRGMIKKGECLLLSFVLMFTYTFFLFIFIFNHFIFFWLFMVVLIFIFFYKIIVFKFITILHGSLIYFCFRYNQYAEGRVWTKIVQYKPYIPCNCICIMTREGKYSLSPRKISRAELKGFSRGSGYISSHITNWVIIQTLSISSIISPELGKYWII